MRDAYRLQQCDEVLPLYNTVVTHRNKSPGSASDPPYTLLDKVDSLLETACWYLLWSSDAAAIEKHFDRNLGEHEFQVSQAHAAWLSRRFDQSRDKLLSEGYEVLVAAKRAGVATPLLEELLAFAKALSVPSTATDTEFPDDKIVSLRDELGRADHHIRIALAETVVDGLLPQTAAPPPPDAQSEVPPPMPELGDGALQPLFWMSTTEVAEELGKSLSVVSKLCKAGRLACRGAGQTRQIDRLSVMRFKIAEQKKDEEARIRVEQIDSTAEHVVEKVRQRRRQGQSE